MKTITWYVVSNRRLFAAMIIVSGISFGIWMDDVIVGGFTNYLHKLQCDNILFSDSQATCINLRNSSIAWFFVMPAISGFLSYGFFARKILN